MRWACSSAGEHYVDIVGVTGSIPVTPTILKASKFNDLLAFAISGPWRFQKRGSRGEAEGSKSEQFCFVGSAVPAAPATWCGKQLLRNGSAQGRYHRFATCGNTDQAPISIPVFGVTRPMPRARPESLPPSG